MLNDLIEKRRNVLGKFRTAILLFAISLMMFVTACSDAEKTLHISSSTPNDLLNSLLHDTRINIRQHDSPLEAVEQAGTGDAVMVLADKYPEEAVELSMDFFRLVQEKKIKAFVEYPSFLPGVKISDPVTSRYERAVVNSSFFRTFPDSLQILSIHGLHYLPVAMGKSHIVAARVAGFDSAVFGVPEKTAPLFFELPGYPVMVATTNMSQFVSGRYAPRQEWVHIWMRILDYLLPGNQIKELKWDPVVCTTYDKGANLPEDYQKQSIKRGINWYFNAKMLAHESYEHRIEKMVASGNERLVWNDTIPVGDGSYGVFECISSQIDEHGNQPIGIIKRGDCISESAMAFACAGTVLDDPRYLEISQNLLNFYLINSSATKNEYGDPKHGAYGLIPWGISNYAWYRASYGDDNARFLLGSLTTSALTDAHQWDEQLMKSLIALSRTTGKNGFRGSRIDLPDFEKNGWQYYYNRDMINIAPHFEAYLWACMLWAYDKTGDPFFLDKTLKAIHITMENYPEGWRWTNGLAQEKARMILPLSWLVRINDTPENREMLLRVVNDLLKLQDDCGAIREELGDLNMGKYPPPQRNEDYGTNEASLIGENGDPVTDLLYTTNFAFLGLNEAYHATHDARIKSALDKLAEFLCRIQVDAKNHKEIDGGWMRAFDYERFEHWGSNADFGWGAWAIESGWTQGWIVTILALREMNTSIWDLTKGSQIQKYYKPLKAHMLYE